MRKTDERVVVSMEFTNWVGEVSESTVLAEFRNVNWASLFIANLLPDVLDDNNGRRYKVEFGNGRIEYITKDGDNEFAKQLAAEVG